MPAPQIILGALLVDANIDGICAALQDPLFAHLAPEAARTACSTQLPDAASEAPWCRVLEAALAAGTPVDFDAGRGSLLSHAARCGGMERMRVLLSRGASVNPPASPDIAGTPLMHAVEHCQAEAVAFLIQQGADVHARDRTGQTALFWAVREANWLIQDLLLEAGADIHAVDHDGRTLLHEALHLATPSANAATSRRHIENASASCARLVGLGVSAERRDARGCSALESSLAFDPVLQREFREAWAAKQAAALSEQVAPAQGAPRRRSL